jgi:hypothetical protein
MTQVVNTQEFPLFCPEYLPLLWPVNEQIDITANCEPARHPRLISSRPRGKIGGLCLNARSKWLETWLGTDQDNGNLSRASETKSD